MMAAEPHLQNRLLAALPSSEFELISRQMRLVSLRPQSILHEQGELLTQAYFPRSGAIVGGILLSDGQFINTHIVGADGMMGGLAALDHETECCRALVQIEGNAWTIGIDTLRQIANQSIPIKMMLWRYQRFLFLQTQLAAACNACHTLEQRLATCLLRLRDSSGSKILQITQERLGDLLGVKRTSVCLTAHKMQQSGIVKIRRGNIQLGTLEMLEHLACECYATMNAYYRSLFADVHGCSAASLDQCASEIAV